MKKSFNFNDNTVTFNASDLSITDFNQINSNCYQLIDVYTDKNITIHYHLKLNFQLQGKVSRIHDKKYFYLQPYKNSYQLHLEAPKGSFNNKTDGTFYCYKSGESSKFEFTFKIYEEVPGALFKSKPSSPTKKKNITHSQWLIEHPLQGGGFNPR